MRWSLLAPLIIFLALSGLFAVRLFDDTPTDYVPSPLIGRSAPALDLTPMAELNSAMLTSEIYAQHDVTIVNVWASWCIPCRAEHPQITELAKIEGVALAPGQLGVEIAARIVGDRREMDDRIDAAEVKAIGFADVRLDHAQILVLRQEVAKPHDVCCGHRVAAGQQLRDEHRPLVSASARDKDMHRGFPPVFCAVLFLAGRVISAVAGGGNHGISALESIFRRHMTLKLRTVLGGREIAGGAAPDDHSLAEERGRPVRRSVADMAPATVRTGASGAVLLEIAHPEQLENLAKGPELWLRRARMRDGGRQLARRAVLTLARGRVASPALLDLWRAHFDIAAAPLRRLGVAALRVAQGAADPLVPEPGELAALRAEMQGSEPLLSPDPALVAALHSRLGTEPFVLLLGAGDPRVFAPAIAEIAAHGWRTVRCARPGAAPLRDLTDIEADDRTALHLMATARFVLAPAGGMAAAAPLFGVPAIRAGVLPRDAVLDGAPGDIAVPQLIAGRDGAARGFGELTRRGLADPGSIARAGLRLIDPTPEDIRAATRELLEPRRSDASDAALQARFADLVAPGCPPSERPHRSRLHHLSPPPRRPPCLTLCRTAATVGQQRAPEQGQPRDTRLPRARARSILGMVPNLERPPMIPRISIPGFRRRRRFRDLSEKEILALAISAEEEDGRIYATYAERLREDFPASAAVFDGMATEEDDHRKRLIEDYRRRFGETIVPIRREHVADFVERRPVWLVENLGIERIRREAADMEREARDFYLAAAQHCSDAGTRKLLGDLAAAEMAHETRAQKLEAEHLGDGAAEEEVSAEKRQFLLTWVQPGLAGLMDGSVSTLAPIFATAFATGDTWTTFIVGLSASVGAGISMGFTEVASDDGRLSGRGAPWKRGIAAGVMTTLGGLGHALPYLIPHFWTATIIALLLVFVELWAIVWIQMKYMETPFLRATTQVVVGGALVLAAGILIGAA